VAGTDFVSEFLTIQLGEMTAVQFLYALKKPEFSTS
jgi:hypothetical protein